MTVPAEIAAQFKMLQETAQTGTLTVDIKNGLIMGWRFQPAKPIRNSRLDNAHKYAVG